MLPLQRLWLKGALTLLVCCYVAWQVLQPDQVDVTTDTASSGFHLVARRLRDAYDKQQRPSAVGKQDDHAKMKRSYKIDESNTEKQNVTYAASLMSLERQAQAAVQDSTKALVTATRAQITERYRRWTENRQSRRSGTASDNHTVGAFDESTRPHTITLTSMMSSVNLDQLWKGESESSFIVRCTSFEPRCRNLENGTHVSRFEQFYRPAKFYPNLGNALALYSTVSVLKPLVSSYQASDNVGVKLLRRGLNDRSPVVAVAFDAYVTKHGSVLSKDVFVPMWPDSTSFDKFLSDHSLNLNASLLTSEQIVKWKRVKEVIVISHLHQGMTWHAMVSEFYRIFALLPFAIEHKDILVHVSGASWARGFQEKLLPSFNISKERLLFDADIQADIVYYTQFIDRNDVPSLGLSYLMNQRIMDNFKLAAERRVSALAATSVAEPDLDGVDDQDSFLPLANQVRIQGHESEYSREVNILCIVRNNPHRGRMIINYPDLKEALMNLSVSYQNKLQRRDLAEAHMKIGLLEHMPTMSAAQSLELYTRADIVIGPHGAGFVNLFAMPPGGHVIELMTSRHLNFYTTSRLGLSYHGVVSPLTNKGLADPTNSRIFNYEPDVKMLVGLVESILDSRFLPSSRND